MRLVLEVESLDGLEEKLLAWAESIKIPVQEAMATTLRAITIYNFGSGGVARTTEWSPLSFGYAESFHEGDRTPTLVLHGELQNSIDMDASDPDHSRVFTDNPYAAIHQFGLVNEDGVQMSPRPFFPIDGTQEGFVLNEYAEHEVRLAAEVAIAELLAK